MPALDETLSTLLSDDARMKQIADIASMLMANSPGKPASEATHSSTTAAEPQTTPAPDLTKMLSAMLAQAPSSSTETAPPEKRAAAEPESSSSPAPGKQVALLATLLPQLMQAMSGNGNMIKSEKVNLVRAMKPYMASRRADSVDRAIKMANMAKVAKSALGMLGR